MTVFAGRRDALRRLLVEKSLDALLVTDETQRHLPDRLHGRLQLSGRHAASETCCISDRRYTTQLGEECPGLELAIRGPAPSCPTFTAEVAASWSCSALGDRGRHTHGRRLREAQGGAEDDAHSPSTPGLVEDAPRDQGRRRDRRDSRRPSASPSGPLPSIRASLRLGRTEKEVADELEYQIRLFGGTCGAFPSIVGVGPRAALPHGRPIARVARSATASSC